MTPSVSSFFNRISPAADAASRLVVSLASNPKVGIYPRTTIDNMVRHKKNKTVCFAPGTITTPVI